MSGALQQSLDATLQQMIRDVIDNASRDASWSQRIQQQVEQRMALKITEQLQAIDITAMIARQVDAGLERLRQRLRQDLSQPGIQNTARTVQLTVMDDAVVAESSLVSRDAEVLNNHSVGGTLTTRNLVVRGSINTDNHAWDELVQLTCQRTQAQLDLTWRPVLINDILEHARTTGIDFEHVNYRGNALIQGDELSAEIRRSGLESVGVLNTLEVSGDCGLGQTLHVRPRRVGINTVNPEMALSVWDEEVSVNIGKRSQDQAYIGTGRRQELALGVNREVALTIDDQSMTTIKSLRIDKWRLSHSNTTPGWSGNRGDFFFNSDPKPDAPFAWVCLGGFRWQPLRSA